MCFLCPKKEDKPWQKPNPEPIEPDMKQLKPHIHALRGFSAAEQRKMREAIRLCVKAFNTKEFRDWCINKKFDDTRQSGKEVYDYIMSGDDKFGSADGDMDIDATIYFDPDTDFIGYTYPSSLKTWINRKFFKAWTPKRIAGNIAHEYCHNLGYKHVSARSHNSVPYSVGFHVAGIAKNLA